MFAIKFAKYKFFQKNIRDGNISNQSPVKHPNGLKALPLRARPQPKTMLPPVITGQAMA